MRGRDNQRARLYRAERRLATYRGCHGDWTTGGRLETVEEMQAWVDTVTQSTWHYRTFGHRHRITVTHNKGRGGSRGGYGAIHMAGYHRCKLIILHEMAHCLAGKGDDGWHGRRFARTYLALVERWIGPDTARALRAAYREEGVRWCQPRPAARGKVPPQFAAYLWKPGQQAARPE